MIMVLLKNTVNGNFATSGSFRDFYLHAAYSVVNIRKAKKQLRSPQRQVA